MTVIKRCLVLLLFIAFFPAAVSKAVAGMTPINGGDVVQVTDDHGTCQTIKPAKTDAAVELMVADPVYDNASSWATLKRQGIYLQNNWINTNKLRSLWSVDDTDSAGLAFGGMDSNVDVDIQSIPVDRYGVYYCSFFNQVTVRIIYRTMVMIPSTNEPNTCTYNVIKVHEDLLLDAYRATISAYTDRLRHDLPGILAQIEKGFIGKNNIPQREDGMKADLKEAVGLYMNDTMIDKMKEMASVVNTPEELKLRMTALDQCKQQAKNK